MPVRIVSPYLVATAAAVGVAVLLVIAPVLAGSVVLLLAGAATVHVTTQVLADEDASWVRVTKWTWLSFVVHLAIGLVISLSDRAVGFFGPDASDYDVLARFLVAHWNGEGPAPPLFLGKEGFTILLAAVYWLFSPHRIQGVIVNCTFAALLVPLLADATSRLFGREAAIRAAVLAVAVPSLLLWPSQLLREASVLLALALIVNCLTRLRERVSLSAAFMFGLAVAALLTLRYYVGLIVLVGAVASLLISRRGGGLGAAVSAASVAAVLVAGAGMGIAGANAGRELSWERLDVVRTDSARTASGFEPEADISTGGRAIRFLPVAYTNFMLGPLPWQVRSVRQLPAVPDAIAWWWMIPAFWRGFRSARRIGGRGRLLLVVPLLALSLPLSLAVGNYGTLVRSRTQLLVFVLPIVALGLAEKRRERTVSIAAATSARLPSTP